MAETSFQEILHSKDLKAWKSFLKSIEKDKVQEPVILALASFLKDESYFQFAAELWNRVFDEETREKILDIWISNVYSPTQTYANFYLKLFESLNLNEKISLCGYFFDLLAIHYFPQLKEQMNI